MSALKYLPVDQNPVFYTQAFRDELEHHFPVLRLSANTKSIMVAPHDLIKFEFDLDGYLITKSVPAYLHWVVARLNGMVCSQDFGPGYEQLLIPDITEVERIRQIYMTTKT